MQSRCGSHDLTQGHKAKNQSSIRPYFCRWKITLLIFIMGYVFRAATLAHYICVAPFFLSAHPWAENCQQTFPEINSLPKWLLLKLISLQQSAQMLAAVADMYTASRGSPWNSVQYMKEGYLLLAWKAWKVVKFTSNIALRLALPLYMLAKKKDVILHLKLLLNSLYFLLYFCLQHAKGKSKSKAKPKETTCLSGTAWSLPTFNDAHCMPFFTRTSGPPRSCRSPLHSSWV